MSPKKKNGLEPQLKKLPDLDKPNENPPRVKYPKPVKVDKFSLEIVNPLGSFCEQTGSQFG
jgi:hypothetical protein